MEEEVLAKSYDSRLMRRLLGYLRPVPGAHRASSLVFLVVQLGAAGARAAAHQDRRRPLPRAQSGRASTLPSTRSCPPTRWTGLTQVALLYLAALVGIFLFEFAQTYIMQYIGQKAMFDLRRELMTHLQRLDIAFYDRNPVGRLVTRVTTDVDVLNDLFASGLVTILGDLLTLGFVVFIDVPS